VRFFVYEITFSYSAECENVVKSLPRLYAGVFLWEDKENKSCLKKERRKIMATATTQGKAVALKALKERRKANCNRKSINNALLYAGSLMYFDCLGCNAGIAVSENYFTRPKLCDECQALKDLGWLE